MARTPHNEQVPRLSSRVQVWPCSLWRYDWFYQFPQSEFRCGELLSLSHPELIRKSYHQLLQVGADAIVTNTSGATSLIMKDYNAEDKVQQVNRESARLALEVCAEASAEVIAIGALGPTTTLLTLNQSPANVLEDAYFEQSLALYEAGIRVFYLEACQDPLNARAALTALSRLEDRMTTAVQKVATARVLDGGVMLFGSSLDDFWELVRPFSVQAFGAIGRFEDVREAIHSFTNPSGVPLAAMVDIFAVASPEGWIESPQSLSKKLMSLRDERDIRIVGTGIIPEPDHIRSLVQTLGMKSLAK